MRPKKECKCSLLRDRKWLELEVLALRRKPTLCEVCLFFSGVKYVWNLEFMIQFSQFLQYQKEITFSIVWDHWCFWHLLMLHKEKSRQFPTFFCTHPKSVHLWISPWLSTLIPCWHNVLFREKKGLNCESEGLQTSFICYLNQIQIMQEINLEINVCVIG